METVVKQANTQKRWQKDCRTAYRGSEFNVQYLCQYNRLLQCNIVQEVIIVMEEKL